MAYRRSPQHRPSSSSTSSPTSRRKYSLRRAASRISSHASIRSISSTLPTDPRPVLVPLHLNLRRLPSRLLVKLHSQHKDASMREPSYGQIGVKRKRVTSLNENAHNSGRPTRGSVKRQKSDTGAMTRRYHISDSNSGSEESEMEIDTPGQWSTSENSESVDEDENTHPYEQDDDDDDSSDDFLINSASSNQLNRLKKIDLVRLYTLTGLVDDAELLTKSEIIESIIAARDDFVELPPSSPPGRIDGASSDYSSDDGNVAGDEETDAGGSRYGPKGDGLRRRATLQDFSKLNRPLKGRSLSMGNVLTRGDVVSPLPVNRKPSVHVEVDGIKTVRRRTSNRSSPTNSVNAPNPTHSPPRLRSRNVSHTLPDDQKTPTSKDLKGKGRVKQVEFKEDIELLPKSPSKRGSKKNKPEQGKGVEEDSDLTELEVLEKALKITKGQPSPRRLRSKDRVVEKAKGKENVDVNTLPSDVKTKKGRNRSDSDSERRHLRITPMRKAKVKIGCLKETDDEDDNDEEEVEEEQEEGEEEEEDELQEDELLVDEIETEDTEEAGEDEAAEAEEVDELVSSASVTPPVSIGRRTPLRKRLRPRRNGRDLASSDGDDEDEGDEEDTEKVDSGGSEGGEEDDGDMEEDDGDMEEAEGDAEEQDDEEQDDEEQDDEEQDDEEQDDDDEATIAVEPRKLRNGKIVGEEDIDMEEDIGEDEDESGDSEQAEEVANVDPDVDGETDEDEPMDDDVDLTVATAKTLVRLRRDDLVRLCATRDLEPIGTKPQLAEALLQWRDRQAADFSSPSSSGTVRPSSTSTTKRKRRRRQVDTSTNSTSSPPVLLRSERTHTDEPRTPVPSKEKDGDQELELDLESLGLEDREIPPEKLQKLEKIGSGGFKDVFIGKFKGRRIAISEFRGQLSAMDIKELKLLGGFDHPNIVRFLGVSIPENTKETPVMIVSELCSNGDLFDYIRNVNAPSLYKVLTMMLDIARGLEYLHTRKPSIIHRDCKSSNILITAKGTAKIADFGLAKVKQSTRSMVRSLVGTVNWQAPELWNAHPKYNHKVDVFSCALVYWEMLQWHLPNKKFPWEGMNEHAIYDVVGAKRQRPSLTGIRKQWCPEIVDLIERMWAQEHQDRPTMSEVVGALEEMVAHR